MAICPMFLVLLLSELPAGVMMMMMHSTVLNGGSGACFPKTDGDSDDDDHDDCVRGGQRIKMKRALSAKFSIRMSSFL